MSLSALELMTYSNLRRRTLTGELVVRVHHTLSSSPLAWTGDPATSGFSAPQSCFDAMSPSAYTPNRDVCALGTEARKHVVDHILDRRSLPPAPDPMTQDIEMLPASPYISVTADLDWALYWIAHQLAATSVPAFQLAVIHRPTPQSKEVLIQPFSDDPGDVLAGMRERERHDYLLARSRVGERQELFFYGRIFADSIVANITFRQTLPFALPTNFWRPERNKGNGKPGWLGRLRWSPGEDPWKVAQEAIAEERNVLRTGWAAVPVDIKQIVIWPPLPKPSHTAAIRSVRALPYARGRGGLPIPQSSYRPANGPANFTYQSRPPHPHQPPISMSPDDLPFHQLRLSPNGPRQVPDPAVRQPLGSTAPVCQCGRPQVEGQFRLPITATSDASSQRKPGPKLDPYTAPEPTRLSLKRPAEQANARIAKKLTFATSPEDPSPQIPTVVPENPKRPHLDSPAIQQVRGQLQPIVNAHHGHRSRTDARQADLMGPEDFEKASLAKIEAMLINLRV